MSKDSYWKKHPKYEEDIKAEQTAYWTALRDKLVDLANECGVSVEELVSGLDVAKQTYYNFKKDPSVGLPIQRHSIIRLWRYLTDPAQYAKRKLSQERYRGPRESLRQRGPDELLKVAGFLPSGNNIPVTEPLLKRLVLRLRSAWLFDDALRAYIVNGFLDDLLDQGRPGRDYYLDELNYDHRDAAKQKKDRQEINTWPLEKLHTRSEYRKGKIKDSYLKAIKNLVSSGKTRFVRSELFELYQSILEHHETSSRIEEIKINDFRFETLSSSSVLDRVGLRGLAYAAEKKVSFNPDALDEASSLPPIVGVEIRCQFILKDPEKGVKETRESYFRYSSTSTHVENMLVAMKDGLCHSLIISGFFIRAVGRSDKSLARVSVALSEKHNAGQTTSPYTKVERVYEGWWVTSNTFLGILKAFRDAFGRWLSEKEERNEVLSNEYYLACCELAEVNNIFYSISRSVYEKNFEPFLSYEAIENKVDEIKKKSDNIQKRGDALCFEKHELEELKKISCLEEHKLKAKAKARRAQLVLLHLSLYHGKIAEAKSIIEKSNWFKDSALDKVVSADNQHFGDLLSVSVSASLMRYRLITGDKEFLSGRRWRESGQQGEQIYSVKGAEEIVRKYIKKTGNINFNCYAMVADFFSTIGVVEFYALDNLERPLREGFGRMMEAAHFSSRIGYERRAAQCLMYGVRYLSRIQKDAWPQIDQISSLLKEVEKVTQKSQSSQDQDWLNAIYHLAKGESLLLVRGNNANLHIAGSLKEFLIALKCSIEIGYMRLVPDCLYNIYRACDQLLQKGQSVLSPDQEDSFKLVRQNPIAWAKAGIYYDDYLEEPLRKVFIQSDYRNAIYSSESFQSTGLGEPEPLDLEKTGSDCKEAALAIWNSWANTAISNQHAFAEKIAAGTFLGSTYAN